MDFKNIPIRKMVFAVLGVAAGLLVYQMTPPDGLSHDAMKVAGIFLWAVFYWIGGIFPFYVTSLSLSLLFVLTKAVPFDSAFTGFLSTTWWFMLGAMGIGAALSKSGLMKRFTYNIMKLFPPTYKGQVMGLLTASSVVTPLIPSLVAKTSMLMPVAKSITDLMGYKPKSKELHGIFLACFASITLLSHMFMNSNFDCYIAMGLLPADVVAGITWGSWFAAASLYTILVVAAIMFLILVMYRPKEETVKMTKDDIQQELNKMEPLNRQAYLVIGILAAAVVLWVTEKSHGIPGYQIALLGFLILLGTGTIGNKEVKNSIPWDTLLMTGSLLGIGAVFDAVGINRYITEAITPFMHQISGNPYIFVTFLAILMYFLKLIYSNTMALVTIVGPILIPIAQAAGINPWAAIYVCMMSAYTWNVIYQNSFMVIGYAAFDGEKNLNFGSLSKLSYLFMAVNIICLWLTVPYWQMLGLI